MVQQIYKYTKPHLLFKTKVPVYYTAFSIVLSLFKIDFNRWKISAKSTHFDDLKKRNKFFLSFFIVELVFVNILIYSVCLFHYSVHSEGIFPAAFVLQVKLPIDLSIFIFFFLFLLLLFFHYNFNISSYPIS